MVYYCRHGTVTATISMAVHLESAGLGVGGRRPRLGLLIYQQLLPLRATSPKAMIVSSIALSAAQRADSLRYVGKLLLLSRRREPANPLLFLRSATTCEWRWE